MIEVKNATLQYTTFKSRGKVIKVELEQICYVESHCSNTHAAVLWLMDKRPLQVPKNLRILEK